ncbi:MAG: hypothetical protein WAN50_02875 [Minisyncoccia bacterium]
MLKTRRVAEGWEHPKDESGEYRSLREGSFPQEVSAWDCDLIGWITNGGSESDYLNFAGTCPKREDYMPDFGVRATHVQMYNELTGTPISGVMPSAEELARWMTDREKVWRFAYGVWLAKIKEDLGECKRRSPPPWLN